MVVWNIEGLMSKLEDPEFISYLKAFSFVCLTETFVNKEDTSNLDNIFNDYTCFAALAKKLSKYGRCSGGVLCLIGTNILHFFQHWPTDHDNLIVFKVDGRFFGYHTDILLFSAYIPPVSSTYYDKKDNPDGIAMLEQTITNILSNNQYNILLCGDLNSRTGSLNFSNDTDIHEMRHDLFDETRQSEDTVVNQFGRSLLSMCAILDLTIVNGTIVNSGNFTYISTHGNSLIDYIIVSPELCKLFSYFSIQYNVLSPHMPIEATLRSVTLAEDAHNIPTEYRSVLRWRDELLPTFIQNIRSGLVTFEINEYFSKAVVDINVATSLITELYLKASDCMSYTISNKLVPSRNAWFDKECRVKKRDVHKLLRKYTGSYNQYDKQCFFSERRSYKSLLREKKDQYSAKMVSELEINMCNAKLFWQNIKKLGSMAGHTSKISKDVWHDHF